MSLHGVSQAMHYTYLSYSRVQVPLSCAFAENDLGLAFALLYAWGSRRFESRCHVEESAAQRWCSRQERSVAGNVIAPPCQRELDQIDDVCALSFLPLCFQAVILRRRSGKQRSVTLPAEGLSVGQMQTRDLVLVFVNPMNLASEPPFSYL